MICYFISKLKIYWNYFTNLFYQFSFRENSLSIISLMSYLENCDQATPRSSRTRMCNKVEDWQLPSQRRGRGKLCQTTGKIKDGLFLIITGVPTPHPATGINWPEKLATGLKRWKWWHLSDMFNKSILIGTVPTCWGSEVEAGGMWYGAR